MLQENRGEYIPSPKLIKNLKKKGVDTGFLLSFLKDLEAGKFVPSQFYTDCSVPPLTHPSIIDRRVSPLVSIPTIRLERLIKTHNLGIRAEDVSISVGDSIVYLGRDQLYKLGVYLFSKTAYGILNGGSATSYADYKKNYAFCPQYIDKYPREFRKFARMCSGVPKGITPAYITENLKPGYSFMFLKFLMLLRNKLEYSKLTGRTAEGILPAFQMTSLQTHKPLLSMYKKYEKSQLLRDLALKAGCRPIEIYTGMQPLIAALTPREEGEIRRIFDRAYGKKDTGIPLPGGHGQNFKVLEPVYKMLYEKGIRYIWLGNVDNTGYTVDPVSLALFALSDKEAAFETSVKTAMDTKGGIIIQEKSGRLNCADIGSGISREMVQDFEKQGKTLLFNCGLGLFNLEKLLKRLPTLQYEIPLRISEQDKDSGRYAQAEQNTWEIIGTIKNPLFFAVEKNKRFVAAKLLMETILSSSSNEKLESLSLNPGLLEAALYSATGMKNLLQNDYGIG